MIWEQFLCAFKRESISCCVASYICLLGIFGLCCCHIFCLLVYILSIALWIISSRVPKWASIIVKLLISPFTMSSFALFNILFVWLFKWIFVYNTLILLYNLKVNCTEDGVGHTMYKYVIFITITAQGRKEGMELHRSKLSNNEIKFVLIRTR